MKDFEPPNPTANEIQMRYSPGRELDSLVAEKVMGWLVDRYNMTGYAREIFNPIKVPKMNTELVTIPAYSTDIAAAWEVVNKMVDMDFHPLMQVKCTTWECSFLFESGCQEMRNNITIKSAEASHAICLAALKAVGYAF